MTRSALLPLSSPTLRPLAVAVVALPLLAGCQTTQPTGQTIADAPGDTCAPLRAAFRQQESVFSDPASAVGAGVVAGAAAGLLVGVLTGSPRAGLAVGAGVMAVGVTAALVTSNYQRMQGQERREALVGHTLAVNRYGERVTGATLAQDRLADCRRNQVRTLQADVRDRRVPRAEGEARLADIRGWWEDDIRLIRQFDGRLSADTQMVTEASRYINSAGLEVTPAFRPYAGIVMQPASARQSAAAGAPEAFALQPGQSVRAVARDGDFIRVQLPNTSRSGFIRAGLLAQEVQPQEHQGATAQKIRVAATDDAEPIGDVATGSSYRVVGKATGWMVVDNNGRRNFVRASALRPTRVDETGTEVVQATASAVASRNAFASQTDVIAAEVRRINLDT